MFKNRANLECKTVFTKRYLSSLKIESQSCHYFGYIIGLEYFPYLQMNWTGKSFKSMDEVEQASARSLPHSFLQMIQETAKCGLKVPLARLGRLPRV